MLFGGYTPIYAAAWAIISTVIVSMLRATTRMNWKGLVKALEEGTRSAIGVAMACAMVGIIVGVASLTGFGLKMTSAILVLGQDMLFLTLFFTMLASIILGMGLPSIPTYIITSSMAAPALVQFGVEPFVSHMFVFYFGILANLTPPVALAAFAGAGIAGGEPNKTGFISLKLAAAGILVPYVFVYSPELLMQGTGAGGAILIGITAAIGIIALGAGFEGYFLEEMNWILRVLSVASAIVLVIPGIVSDLIGFSLLALVVVFQVIKRRKKRANQAISTAN